MTLPVLSVRTEAMSNPGPLLARATATKPLVFQRAGEGMVGIGEALRLTFSGPTRMQDAANVWRRVAANATIIDPIDLPGSGLVAFGSFAFADDSAVESVLVVPSVVVGHRDGIAWMTTVSVDGAVPADPPASDAGAVFGARLVPGALSAAGFGAAVSAAVSAIVEGRASKIVLARDLVGSIPVDADLRIPLSALAARYPDTFTFAVDGLMGSSPETLVRAVHGTVSARVLAGSAARGADAAADAIAEAELAASSKDLAEHDFARANVLASLAPFASGLTDRAEPFTLRLPNLWHLGSDITGTLTQDASALDLVAALHPTAAVAGTPTDAAVALISELEPFDRGRYAGPVGWVDAAGDGEWAIALRCAQVSPDGTVTAYAGAGIVADSDPARELAETTLKFTPITDAFTA